MNTRLEHYLIYFFCISTILFLSQFTSAQTSAPPGIFTDTVYHSVKITSDIVYGSNFNFLLNQPDTLKLDTYETDSTVDYLRPVVIYIHGGGFTNGNKTTDKALVFGNYFAKCGYLYASIDYRLYVDDPYDTIDNYQEVYMSTEDAKSAVRFFRKNASAYCVDTSMIFLIGTSAGGAICLNAAYWDQDEADDVFDTSPLGLLDNSSGNEGFSSKPTVIIPCWGGIPDTAWLQDETTPNLLFHGTADPVVPYVWGLSANGVYLFGSFTIHEACIADNIESYLHPFVGAGHGVAQGTPQFDTLLQVSTDFLYNHLNAGEGSVACGATAINHTEPVVNNSISISTINDSHFEIRNHNSSYYNGMLRVYSTTGILVSSTKISVAPYNSVSLNCSALANGCYLAVMVNEKEGFTQKLIIEK